MYTFIHFVVVRDKFEVECGTNSTIAILVNAQVNELIMVWWKIATKNTHRYTQSAEVDNSLTEGTTRSPPHIHEYNIRNGFVWCLVRGSHQQRTVIWLMTLRNRTMFGDWMDYIYRCVYKEGGSIVGCGRKAVGLWTTNAKTPIGSFNCRNLFAFRLNRIYL